MSNWPHSYIKLHKKLKTEKTKREKIGTTYHFSSICHHLVILIIICMNTFPSDRFKSVKKEWRSFRLVLSLRWKPKSNLPWKVFHVVVSWTHSSHLKGCTCIYIILCIYLYGYSCVSGVSVQQKIGCFATALQLLCLVVVLKPPKIGKPGWNYI